MKYNVTVIATIEIDEEDYDPATLPDADAVQSAVIDAWEGDLEVDNAEGETFDATIDLGSVDVTQVEVKES